MRERLKVLYLSIEPLYVDMSILHVFCLRVE